MKRNFSWTWFKKVITWTFWFQWAIRRKKCWLWSNQLENAWFCKILNIFRENNWFFNFRNFFVKPQLWTNDNVILFSKLEIFREYKLDVIFRSNCIFLTILRQITLLNNCVIDYHDFPKWKSRKCLATQFAITSRTTL